MLSYLFGVFDFLTVIGKYWGPKSYHDVEVEEKIDKVIDYCKAH